jgi:serine/threonine-protein kinase SRPK3
MFCHRALTAPEDLKPDNILITLPNAEEAIQRHTTGLLTSAKQEMSDSFPPVVLSQPIIPDNLLNANDLSSSLEIQLTDFGTGDYDC